ncbi:hypothetical protein GCM10020256_00560 [Streptomyces thermocoprophilus]
MTVTVVVAVPWPPDESGPHGVRVVTGTGRHRHREQVPAPLGHVPQQVAGRPVARHVDDRLGDGRVLDDGRGEGPPRKTRALPWPGGSLTVPATDPDRGDGPGSGAGSPPPARGTAGGTGRARDRQRP